MREIIYAIIASMIISFFGAFFSLQISTARAEEKFLSIKEKTSQIVPRSELEKEMLATRNVINEIRRQVECIDNKMDKILIAFAGGKR